MAAIFGRVRKVIASVLAVPSMTPNSKSSDPEKKNPRSQTGPPDCTCSHRMTIHYYGGHGVTEHCLVFGCPCVLYERPYVKPPNACHGDILLKIANGEIA